MSSSYRDFKEDVKSGCLTVTIIFVVLLVIGLNKISELTGIEELGTQHYIDNLNRNNAREAARKAERDAAEKAIRDAEAKVKADRQDYLERKFNPYYSEPNTPSS